MRVAQKTIYEVNQYRLGNLTSELNTANKVISTGKRINKLSDDPVGLTRVLDIKASLSNLDQLQRNISTGRTWLNTGESTLKTAKDLITDSKVLSIAMHNDAVNESDRADAAAKVNGILRQIQGLANTRINGDYIFAGTKTNLKPFEFDNDQDPARVDYFGNDQAFAVKTGKDTNVVVGHDGAAVFFDAEVTVDETNNRIDFSEDSGATELTATIPSGSYTADQLAAAIKSAMDSASALPAGTADYTVAYDAANRSFAIQDGSGALGELQLLWATGSHAANSIAPDLGFGTSGDDNGATGHTGDSGVQWGIFKTLIDLQGYLENNDGDGIVRSMTRLDTHLNHMIGTVSGIGAKENRLDMKEQIIADVGLSLEENQSQLEDADIVQAISHLQAKEIAYRAALASSAKVMQLSLVDYV